MSMNIWIYCPICGWQGKSDGFAMECPECGATCNVESKRGEFDENYEMF
jgi:hypothetical protein